MKLKEYSQLVISGASWKHVLDALGGFSAHDGGTEEVLAALVAAPATRESRDLALIAENAILVANHSIGERYVRLSEGCDQEAQPYIADEDFNGGWLVATPDTTEEIEFSSASSGSAIRAEKMGDGSWTITGTFPILDGKRYEGSYFRAFKEAAAIPMADTEQRSELERLRKIIDTKIKKFYHALDRSPIVEMDSFQGWDFLERSYATDQEFEEVAAFLTNNGLEAIQSVIYGYGDPVKVISARITGDFIDEAELEKLAGYGWLEHPYGPQLWSDVSLLTIR